MFKKFLVFLLTLGFTYSCKQNHIFKDVEQQKEVFIGLANYGLDSIPPEIGYLKKVEELTIAKDSTRRWTIYPPSNVMAERTHLPPHKNLPEEFTKLTKLKKLYISGLDIKYLPDKFSELKNLEVLHLAMNKLNVAQEINKLQSLPNLKVLYLDGNKVDTLQLKNWKAERPDIEIHF